MLLAPPPILGIDKLIIIIVQTCWILPVYNIQNLLYLNIQLTMLHIAWLKNSSDPTHGIEDGNERVYDPKKGIHDVMIQFRLYTKEYV